MSLYIKYKGVRYRAVDAIGAFSVEAEKAASLVRKEIEKAETFINVAKQLVSLWESAYAIGDFKRANSIKANIKVNAKWNRDKLAGADLPYRYWSASLQA